MKKNILVQIGTEVIENQMPILDDDGNETGEFETVRKEIPIMESQYVEMTAEEIAEMETEPIQTEPTLEEKLNALYQYMGLTISSNGVVVKEVYSADNPIRWVDGMTPINNAYYIKDDGKIYVYMDGNWIEW